MALPDPPNYLKIHLEKQKEIEQDDRWEKLNKEQDKKKRLFLTSPIRRKKKL